MANLTLSFFGALQATLNGAPILEFKSNKVRALLAYLVVEASRSHPREILAGLFWPEMPTSSALSNLRNALSNLRLVLGGVTGSTTERASPYLLITHEVVQFNGESDYWLDVAVFQTHLQQAETLAAGVGSSGGTFSDEPEVIHHLQSAVALYSEPFLHAFWVDSAPFEEWVLFKREEYQRQCIEALGRLADYYERHGEFRKAQVYVRQQLEMEPWQEEAHRQLMRLLAKSNQRSAAMSQYMVCRRLLAAEMDVEPSQETRRLYEAIRDGELYTTGPETMGERRLWTTSDHLASSIQSGPEDNPSFQFVARQQELAKLQGFLDQALLGRGKIVFVTGDSGSGKTALLAEFARQAMASEPTLVSASGSCRSLMGWGDPYVPFGEILQRLGARFAAKVVDGELSPASAHRQGAVLAIQDSLLEGARAGVEAGASQLPGDAFALQSRAPELGSSSHRQLAESAMRIAEQMAGLHVASLHGISERVAGVLRACAGQHPLLLIIDDLQWADPLALSLLFQLSRQLAGYPILVVGAFRPGDISTTPDHDRHPLKLLVHELQRSFGDVLVDLDKADGRSFVEAYLDSMPSRLDSSFLETLYQYTDGQPLFTVELCQGFQQRGDLVLDASGMWVRGTQLDWEKLPPRVEAAIAQCIDHLPAESQSLLEVASVEGTVFTAEVLAQLSHLALHEVLWSLTDLQSKQHRLVCAHGVERLGPEGKDPAGRLSRYRFVPILVQKYLYNRLDEVARACLHEAVAHALEALYGAQACEIAGQLALHYERAGLPAKAAAYRLLAAGDSA